MRWLVFLSLFAFFHHFLGRTVAFSERGFDKNPTCTHSRIKARTMTLQAVSTAKQNLLDSLDDPTGFNSATSERTKLVEELTKTNTTPKPGSINGFAQFAEGTWRIVYAPHIFTMGSLAGGSFDPVYYIMKPGRIMTSHARYSFPLVGSGWLSVSGTYGSEDEDRTCRVDFDKAWVTFDNNRSDANKPVASFEDIPESTTKTIIQNLGQLGFVKTVSVFPVSYLDNDTIVFDFELLGTRICARKVGSIDYV